jgi:hypothetical protein
LDVTAAQYTEKNPLFWFLFVFWRISSSRRSLASHAVGEEILLYFYVPMFLWKDCYDGTDQENPKKQEGRNGGKKKKRFFCYLLGGSHTRVFSISQEWPWATTEVPILVCSPSTKNALALPPLCDPPSGEPTCMGTSPTTCHCG